MHMPLNFQVQISSCDQTWTNQKIKNINAALPVTAGGVAPSLGWSSSTTAQAEIIMRTPLSVAKPFSRHQSFNSSQTCVFGTGG